MTKIKPCHIANSTDYPESTSFDIFIETENVLLENRL